MFLLILKYLAMAIQRVTAKELRPSVDKNLSAMPNWEVSTVKISGDFIRLKRVILAVDSLDFWIAKLR